MELENDFLDDLRVKSVPPHISEVVTSKNNGGWRDEYSVSDVVAKDAHAVSLVLPDMFWRYDMDSYAANRHNEDRSQYIHDSFTDEATGESTPLFFCACYDGHGGEQAVEFVQRNLYKNIKSRLVAGGESTKLSIVNVRALQLEYGRMVERVLIKLSAYHSPGLS